MMRTSHFRALLAGAALATLASPAFALDGADLLTKLNATYATSGVSITSSNPVVDGSTVTLTQTERDGTTSPLTVTLAADATVTVTQDASASDAKVGLCALAQGETDSTGAVAATSIRLSEATDGSCTTSGGRR